MLVFVYGTLKRGFSNHYLLETAEFVSEATIESGYKMVSLAWYPAILKDESSTTPIHGEVYRLTSDKELEALDFLEGYVEEGSDRNFYTRITEDVSFPNGNQNISWKGVYVYTLDSSFADRPHIESGIWGEASRTSC